jgi:hypothetical protein
VNGSENPLTVSIIMPAVVRLRPVMVPEMSAVVPPNVTVNVPWSVRMLPSGRFRLGLVMTPPIAAASSVVKLLFSTKVQKSPDESPVSGSVNRLSENGTSER